MYLIIIQIVIVFLVIVYMYVTFRHNVKISTVESYIKDISPALTELTKTRDTLVFWFYSVSEGKFKKYILDNKMKIHFDVNAEADSKINNLENNFYFNFGMQRWEKITFYDKKPTINMERNIIEQQYSLCYLDDINGNHNSDDDIICQDMKYKAFIKLNIRDQRYIWKNDKLYLDIKSVFPTDSSTCKFTINRYKEYLNVYYDYRDEGDGNIEQKMGVYFMKNEQTNKWELKKCERPNEMYFDGSTCRNLNDDKTGISGSRKLFVKNREFLKRKFTHSDLKHVEVNTIVSFGLQLNSNYFMYVNMNVSDKIYPLNLDIYKSCKKTLFVIGIKKDPVASDLQGENYDWKLEQIIDRKVRDDLQKDFQDFCPLLEHPLRILDVRSGEIKTVDKPFIMYKNHIFYMKEDFLRLYNKISSTNEYVKNENENGYVKNQDLLPSSRIYTFENHSNTKCKLYSKFIGKTIIDVFIDKDLLVDYLDNSHYTFFNRISHPLIRDDFHIKEWSFMYDVENSENFIYLSIIDLYGIQ